ncbi:MAG TPA: peptide ABC transporter substrate-binding protein [Candidatus Dormibacteraeota bacterium]|nr:peptide ABC transporter substrate-binding protein [Candidatus Dormibacteraeota bacterium]
MQSGTRSRAVALASAGMFVVAACSGGGGGTSTNLSPSGNQILRANNRVEPNSYDPTQQTYVEAAVGRNVFESLLKPKADLSDVQPAAAKSYDVSSDGLTYTFHLQTNAKWSDGKPVTAGDWVYGYQHLLNPALAAGFVDPFFVGTIAGAQNYGSVDVSSASAIDSFLSGLGLSAPEANTFVIKLQNPAAYFKWVVTLWVAVPISKDVVQSAAGGAFASNDTTKPLAWANNANTIIGNGPFKIAEIASKDHVTMVPNPGYWGPAPKLQQIIYYFIADGNIAFSKYRTGALDMIAVPAADVTVVRSDATLSRQAHLFPRLTTFWMSFNTKKPPFDNAKVRMAFAKAIDRDKLTQDVRHDTDKPIQSFIPKGMAGYDTTDNAQSFDPAAARKLLSDASVSASTLNTFKVLTRDTTGSKAINQFIVDQWNTNLGLSIQLDVIDGTAVTSRIRKGIFDIYGPDGWGVTYPDQQDWFDVFTSGSCHNLNFGCPTLAGYDDLVKKANTELDQNQRNKDYLTAQKMLIDQAAVGFIYQEYEFVLIAPYVNITPNPFDDQNMPGNLNFQTAYITAH